jgi:hypothetical protein
VYAVATRMQCAWDSAQLAPEAPRLLKTLAGVLKEAVMVDKVVQDANDTKQTPGLRCDAPFFTYEWSIMQATLTSRRP